MTDTAKTIDSNPQTITSNRGAGAMAISPREYGYIRLLAAISRYPEELLLADYLARKADRN